MEATKIKVTAYYGVPSYYSVMPQAIFDALEAASLNGEEYALVDKVQFDKMIEDYQNKIRQ
ncbi:MAG: hypothetical protein LBR26_03195 [Prevotella sp.]|jgi:hypothetical protein|nr:hypothetical protein [Prevotella sp.]